MFSVKVEWRVQFSAALLVGLVFCSNGVAADAKSKPSFTARVDATDGVKLATDVYLPSGEGRFPAVLVLTPYGRSGLAGFAKECLERGYALVSQDMRGRGDSEGSNVVIFQSNGWEKPADGHQTVRWITEQKWSNGKVATFGGSAVGITQNLLAPGAPEALCAQFVEVASSSLYDQCMYQGGAFRKSMIEGWLLGTGMTKGNLDAFRAHPAYDDFWETMNPEKFADRTVAPAIFVGGWYDIFCQGTINSFVSIQTQGGPRAKGKCRLIMGPWAHGTFEDLKYPHSERPQAANALRFFDLHVLGKANGVESEKPVHYYVMGDPDSHEGGANEWRQSDTWPPASKVTAFHFHDDGSLKAEPPATDGKSVYRYDPKNPVPTVGGQNLILPKGPKDQREVEKRDDVLVFTSDVLAAPLEVTGRILAKLFVETDGPDTDFTVKLCDVYPDGRSMLVTDGIRRARYNRSYEKPEALAPGTVYELVVDLSSTSLVFGKGHRIRVAVSSSNFPRFDANPNTGKNSWEESSPRVATNSLHLAPGRPSHVALPVAGPINVATAKGK